MADAVRPGSKEDRANREADEKARDAQAEADARREVDDLHARPPLPGGRPGSTSSPIDLPRTPGEASDAGLAIPPADAVDPALAVLRPQYEALGLPVGASLERIESTYRTLKDRWNPEKITDDPVAQARARQEDARLDEAYLTLRKALVRERRL